MKIKLSNCIFNSRQQIVNFKAVNFRERNYHNDGKNVSSDIRRLTAADRKELIEVLNFSFKGDKICGYFEQILPQMWIDDDVYMPKHLAVFEDGKIIAALGIYPYKIIIAGEELMFATVGNVATLPEARKKVT